MRRIKLTFGPPDVTVEQRADGAMIVRSPNPLPSHPDAMTEWLDRWAKVAPADFLGTAANELAGTAKTPTYGPPYNNQSGSVQRIGWSWQTIAGVRQPIDPADTFVLSPLTKASATDSTLASALAR